MIELDIDQRTYYSQSLILVCAVL